MTGAALALGGGTLRWPGLRALLAAVARFEGEPEDRLGPDPVQIPPIGSLKRRDPAAWRILFEREMPAVYKYALGRLGNASDAEDLAGHVFEEAWKHAESLEDRGLPARAWLFGIARNLIASHHRKWFKQQPALALEAFDSAEHDPGLDPELLDLARAIKNLAAAHAEVITLRFIHGLSLQEAAAVMGTSVDGVKGRQARALAELRERLGIRVQAVR